MTELPVLPSSQIQFYSHVLLVDLFFLGASSILLAVLVLVSGSQYWRRLILFGTTKSVPDFLSYENIILFEYNYLFVSSHTEDRNYSLQLNTCKSHTIYFPFGLGSRSN